MHSFSVNYKWQLYIYIYIYIYIYNFYTLKLIYNKNCSIKIKQLRYIILKIKVENFDKSRCFRLVAVGSLCGRSCWGDEPIWCVLYKRYIVYSISGIRYLIVLVHVICSYNFL